MIATVSQKGPLKQPRNTPGEIPSPSGEQSQSPPVLLGKTEGTVWQARKQSGNFHNITG